MKTILAVLAAGLAAGAIVTAHAKLPAPPPMSDSDKAAAAQKAAAAKAAKAAQVDKAQDRAVTNYKKNKGMSMGAKK